MKRRKNIDLLSPEELKEYIKQLQKEHDDLVRQIAEDEAAWGLEPEPETEPEPDAEPEPEKPLRLPTAKMRRAVERFEQMSDEEQRRHLGNMF